MQPTPGQLEALAARSEAERWQRVADAQDSSRAREVIAAHRIGRALTSEPAALAWAAAMLADRENGAARAAAVLRGHLERAEIDRLCQRAGIAS